VGKKRPLNSTEEKILLAFGATWGAGFAGSRSFFGWKLGRFRVDREVRLLVGRGLLQIHYSHPPNNGEKRHAGLTEEGGRVRLEIIKRGTVRPQRPVAPPADAQLNG
jgi:hypothetical protein